MITYKKQFDLFTEKYISGDIEACDSTKCFCGTMFNNTDEWYKCVNQGTVTNEEGLRAEIKKHLEGFYYPQEIASLEHMFVSTFTKNGGAGYLYKANNPQNEEALFIAFEKTLALLKEIHRLKGEDVEGQEGFKKRKPAVFVQLPAIGCCFGAAV